MSTLVAQTISNGTVSTSSANVIQGSAKAWVNFNGTNGVRNASYNVSSVTRNSAGNYTINFTNAFSDGSYCPSAWINDSYQRGTNNNTLTATSFNFNWLNTLNGAATDAAFVGFSFFR
jgi:hypothetical protein